MKKDTHLVYLVNSDIYSEKGHSDYLVIKDTQIKVIVNASKA